MNYHHICAGGGVDSFWLSAQGKVRGRLQLASPLRLPAEQLGGSRLPPRADDVRPVAGAGQHT